jgi:polyhydroxyalkanoate synthase
LAKATDFGKAYQHLSNLWSVWDNDFVEPLRDTLWRTPSYKVTNLEKYSLFRYYNGKTRVDKDKDNNRTYPTTPLLIVYAFINRHYILDLLPEVSVVGSLLRQGFDIFATDWGTPSAYDKDLTIGHFVNSYMDRSVDLIREITKTDKVSLFGYCWGGNLVLIYAALHPEKVKNVITIATPGDFSLDDTLLSVWTKGMDVDMVLDVFGNVPSILLNEAFALRNPVEYSHKYPHFFEQPHGLESIMEFLATETWLYDTPPVIGEIYREFVKYCYQQNLFIINKMNVDGAIVNLKNINMPFLNVVAQRDDLVVSRSSIALNNAVGSVDKSAIEFQSGHVGLIIGQRAHKEFWPKVGNWLKERSWTSSKITFD